MALKYWIRIKISCQFPTPTTRGWIYEANGIENYVPNSISELVSCSNFEASACISIIKFLKPWSLSVEFTNLSRHVFLYESYMFLCTFRSDLLLTLFWHLRLEIDCFQNELTIYINVLLIYIICSRSSIWSKMSKRKFDLCLV